MAIRSSGLLGGLNDTYYSPQAEYERAMRYQRDMMQAQAGGIPLEPPPPKQTDNAVLLLLDSQGGEP